MARVVDSIIDNLENHHWRRTSPQRDLFMVLLPMLIVILTMLFILLIFLICAIIMRRRRGIHLGDNDGPVDLSREDLAEGAGGFAGVESRWLETVDEEERRMYRRAKDWQTQHPPNSLPTDITLSQFLSIQEKGVSAWAFEPDYESMPSALVHARTEITFLPDPSSFSTVQSNLPLPKLNEVYYWEVKMFDLPPSTNVSVGLATKPYPLFRLPGHSRFSIAYHSNGDKSYNWPFTASSFGPALKEGDVLGIGYRPRTGTVFFTRNGRKTEDAFIGMSRWNLFPSIGADGPCSVHVNLGQAGFVHIEANVKKWGLAPSVGTLAPPPAYGSERGSILLEAGAGTRISQEPHHPPPSIDAPSASSSASSRRSIRRAHHHFPPSSSVLHQPSPLRGTPLGDNVHFTISEDPLETDSGPSGSDRRYMSPTDVQYADYPRREFPPAEGDDRTDWPTQSYSSRSTASDPSPIASSSISRRPQLNIQSSSIPEPSSPAQTINLPTPHMTDIHMHDLNPSSSSSHLRTDEEETSDDEAVSPVSEPESPPPPGYAPVDPHRYPNGVTVEIPPAILAAALEERPNTSTSSERR